jgi:hypothetical protein
VRFRDLHFLAFRGAGAGDGSFVLPAWFAVKGHKVSLDVLSVRVDRAIGFLWLLSAGKIRSADAVNLAQAIATHMRSTLTVPVAGAPVHP